MVDLTDRQKRELAALDFPMPCTVAIGGALGRSCEQAAVWQMECKGCVQRAVMCEEHHDLLVRTAGRWKCPQCDREGPLAEVFLFERIRVQS
jgi:hypothetical protein